MDGSLALNDFGRRILILGDGNFSFSLSFAEHKLGLKRKDEKGEQSSALRYPQKETIDNQTCSYTLYATSYDSQEVVNKNENAVKNVQSLNELNSVVVLHNVDATNLRMTFNQSINFKTVIFNFPHVGGKSNIRACRRLLENSFKSIIEFIDDDSHVLITLCRGQGGTPIDVSRNGYGNSWQVATQAAKAGLVLSNVINFESVAPPDYVSAGYRGKLQNGFVKREALTHIFKKGTKIAFPALESVKTLSKESLISMVDDYFLHGLDLFNPFQLSWHPFHACSTLLRSIFVAANTKNQSELQPHSPINGSCKQDNYIQTCNTWSPLDRLTDAQRSSKIEWTSQIFVDSVVEISPFTYPVYEECIFVDSTAQFISVQEFVARLKLSFEGTFQSCILDVSIQNDKIKGITSIPEYEINSESKGFDCQAVPYFLMDIPIESWLNLKPEATVSHRIEGLSFKSTKVDNEQTSSVEYERIDFDNYAMSERELRYFAKEHRQKSFCCFVDDCLPSCTFKVNGMTVGKAGVLKLANKNEEDETNPSKNRCNYIAIFRTDLLSSALLQTDDLRLFWNTDETYLANLKQCLVNLDRSCELSAPRVVYPLCYRHDLCFWVNEIESEDVILAAIRHCCNDVVHSVRLLRILRHEESKLLSFCYRIIYSRCDGPLSHNETVELQNRLRLLLLDLKFELR